MLKGMKNVRRIFPNERKQQTRKKLSKRRREKNILNSTNETQTERKRMKSTFKKNKSEAEPSSHFVEEINNFIMATETTKIKKKKETRPSHANKKSDYDEITLSVTRTLRR